MVDLFFRFFKISILTFGGGYAMMPMVEKELINRDGLLKEDEIIDDYAMGQSIPGIIGVNASALMGYRIAGRVGLSIAILGFITPSIIIISLISSLLLDIENNIYIVKAFTGLRAGVVALMLNALLNIGKKSLKSLWAYGLLVIAVVGILFFKFHPIYLILFGGFIGFVIGETKDRREKC